MSLISVTYIRKKNWVLLFWFALFPVLIYSEIAASREQGLDIGLTGTGFLLYLACSWIVSIDFRITEDGVVWGSWLIRFFCKRCDGSLISWDRIRLMDVGGGRVAFFLTPFGHIWPFLYVDAWKFLDEVRRRVAEREPWRVDPALRRRIERALGRSPVKKRKKKK